MLNHVSLRKGITVLLWLGGGEAGTLQHLRPCFHSVCAACLQCLSSNSEGDAFDCPRCGRRTQKMSLGLRRSAFCLDRDVWLNRPQLLVWTCIDLWDSKPNTLKSWWQFLGSKTCWWLDAWRSICSICCPISGVLPQKRTIENLNSQPFNLQRLYLHVCFWGCLFVFSPLLQLTFRRLFFLKAEFIEFPHFPGCFSFAQGKRYINICPTSICFTTSTVKR